MKYFFFTNSSDKNDPVTLPFYSRRSKGPGAEEGAVTVDVLLGDRVIETADGPEFLGTAALMESKLCRKGNKLCLYDGEKIYQFPMGEIVGIRKINQGIPAAGWNKKKSPKEKRYQQAGVMLFRDSFYGLKFFYAIEFLHGGEQYRLLFPAYELQKIREMTTQMTLEESGSISDEIRPSYYWKIPKNAGSFFSPYADVTFRARHPVAYWIIISIGITALLLPGILVLFFTIRIPGSNYNAVLLLGFAGGFVVGLGLFNLVAAWLHQYLGHIFTIICLLAGAGMITATFLVLLH